MSFEDVPLFSQNPDVRYSVKGEMPSVSTRALIFG
jgi:hypothetical protein